MRLGSFAGDRDELVRLGAYDYEYQAAGLGDLGEDGTATWWPTTPTWWPTTPWGWVGLALVGTAVAGGLWYLMAE